MSWDIIVVAHEVVRNEWWDHSNDNYKNLCHGAWPSVTLCWASRRGRESSSNGGVSTRDTQQAWRRNDANQANISSGVGGCDPAIHAGANVGNERVGMATHQDVNRPVMCGNRQR